MQTETTLRRAPAALVLALAIAVVLAWVVPGALHAQRQLSWDALEVAATVESDGALHVIEEHEMVFDGDWNGGERVFRLGRHQEIELLGIERIDPETGERRAVQPGSLDLVDRWAWTDGTTLRWRSRLPSDPPFENEQIVYRLGYRLTGVLIPQGDGVYLLDHDFVFTDRDGVIRRFTLDLTIEQPFEAVDESEVPRDLDLRNLRPRTSVPRTVRLRYLGEGVPAAAAPPPPSLLLRVAALAVLLSALGLTLALFVRSETGKGRLWGELPAAGVDRAWLEREVFSLPPEVVGAIWDRKVGSAEVSAVLARLVAEGRLATEVAETDSRGKPKEMRLTRLEPLSSFDPRDRPLVRAILYRGRWEVTTRELRDHYESEGFQPVELVKDWIEERVEDVLGGGVSKDTRSSAKALVFLVMLAAPVVLIAGQILFLGGPALPMALLALAAAFFLGAGIARSTQRRVHRLRRWTLRMLLPALAFLVFVIAVVLAPSWLPGDIEPPGHLSLAVLLALTFLAWIVPLWIARSSDSPRAIEIRQRFVRAREHLKAELERPEPDLDDSWFPYLLAFGLSTAMGRWAEEFGGTVASSAGFDGSTAFTGGGSSGGSSGSGFSSGGWTGGGQAFGGAGASASWAAATGSMTSGVSPPSSSSGGGGGGGGSSSGGGGGGGW